MAKAGAKKITEKPWGKAFQKIISKNVDVYPQIGGVSPEILETMTFHFFMYTLVVHPLEI